MSERVLVCGSRDWTDWRYIRDVITDYSHTRHIEVIIEGDARGADRYAGRAAVELGIPLMIVPARWGKFGNSAGPRRNAEMLHKGKPTIVFAFHDELRLSKGTKHMCRISINASLPVTCYHHIGDEGRASYTPTLEEVS